MSTLVILGLLLLTGYFVLIKRFKISIITFAFTLIIYLIIGNGLIGFFLVKHLESPFVNNTLPNWKEHNAIVVLGAGTIKLPKNDEIKPTVMSYSRISKGAELYFSCIKNHKKCHLIISGGDAVGTGLSEAEVYRLVLIRLGVNDNDITLESRSLNTYKNAEYTQAILQKNPPDQIFLVTSGFHLKRSLLYFSNFSMHPQPILSDYLSTQLTLFPNGYNFAITDFALHEYLGILRYYIYNGLGLNKKI